MLAGASLDCRSSVHRYRTAGEINQRGERDRSQVVIPRPASGRIRTTESGRCSEQRSKKTRRNVCQPSSPSIDATELRQRFTASPIRRADVSLLLVEPAAFHSSTATVGSTLDGRTSAPTSCVTSASPDSATRDVSPAANVSGSEFGGTSSTLRATTDSARA